MRKYLPILLILALGCMETTGLSVSSCSGSGPGGICGTWVADSLVTGASLVLNLRLRNEVLSGTGTYSIEAGRSGTLDVGGTYRSPAIAMNLEYDYGFVAPFTGTLTSSQQIVGSFLNSSGHAVPLTFSPR
jgi:hypothetical protein